MSLVSWQGIDGLFTVIRVATIATLLIWPFTVIPSVMSLGGHTGSAPPLQIAAARVFWFLVLIYPVIFFALIRGGEFLAKEMSYSLGACVALIPVALTGGFVFWFLK